MFAHFPRTHRAASYNGRGPILRCDQKADVRGRAPSQRTQPGQDRWAFFEDPATACSTLGRCPLPLEPLRGNASVCFERNQIRAPETTGFSPVAVGMMANVEGGRSRGEMASGRVRFALLLPGVACSRRRCRACRGSKGHFRWPLA